MARECKAGNWVFRIDPGNDAKLQRAAGSSSSFSQVWAAPNGERILGISAKGEEVVIETNRHKYVRNKNGNVK